MTIRSRLAVAAMAAACLQAGPLLAQNAPAPDTAAKPAPAPSPEASAPAAAKDDKPAAKSPKRIKVSEQTRQQIDHALKTGTVPARYRSKVPKEYQKYIPFDR